MYTVQRDYGEYPVYTRPAPQKRQRRRLWLFVSVVMLLSVLVSGLVGGVAGFWVARATTPEVQAVVQETAQPVQAAPTLDQPVSEQGVLPPVQSVIFEEESATISAVQKVQPAVVTVLSQGRFGVSSGSGVIISPEGYIVTNNHVVQGAGQLGVIFSDGRQAEARMVGAFELTDLAVIQVEEAVPAVAELGDSGALQPGSRVIAIGSALGRFQNTVTTGIVSALNRQVGTLTGLIQTDAPINSGNSGGPLINSAGQVVGLNTLVVRGGASEAEGLGFAVPSNTVRAVAEQLIANGEVNRVYLGITFQAVDPNQASDLGLDVGQGVMVKEVVAGSPVGEAGLQAQDVIVSIGGQKLNADTSLLNVMLNFGVGEQVEMEIVRAGQPQTLLVELGAFPARG